MERLLLSATWRRLNSSVNRSKTNYRRENRFAKTVIDDVWVVKDCPGNYAVTVFNAVTAWSKSVTTGSGAQLTTVTIAFL